MLAVYAAVTPTILLMLMGVCALSWVVALATFLLARRRGRRLSAQYKRQLADLSSLAGRHERRSEQYGALLLQTKRELSSLSERHIELMTRLDAMQRASSERRTVSDMPQHEHQSVLAADENVARLHDLQEALMEMRRGRELAEQRAEKLRVANQVQIRKIAALSTQLDEVALSVQETRVALQDRERQTAEVQERLGTAMGRVQLLIHEREQLELQNLELKQMLDQLGRSQVTAQPMPGPRSSGEAVVGKSSQCVADDWQRVSESDIHDVIVSLAEESHLLRGAGEDPERLAERPSVLREAEVGQETLHALSRQVSEFDPENVALGVANSGTYPVARPMRSVTSESREMIVAPLDTAVLSDNLGLPIAAKGALSSESLAAVAGLALSNAERVRELLPVGPITTVQWIDQSGTAVTCKLLRLGGDEMGMTTFGVGTPSEEVLRETLKSILSSIGWNEKGPLEDESKIATG